MAFEGTRQGYGMVLASKADQPSPLQGLVNMKSAFKQAQYAFNLDQKKAAREHMMKKELQQTDIASQEKIAGMKVDAAKETAGLGGSLQTARFQQQLINDAVGYASKLITSQGLFSDPTQNPQKIQAYAKAYAKRYFLMHGMDPSQLEGVLDSIDWNSALQDASSQGTGGGGQDNEIDSLIQDSNQLLDDGDYY